MIMKATDYLITQLKSEGFSVMRYDSITTNSVYLKLDDGVGGSIRISDHEGKKQYSYKYNLIKGNALTKLIDGKGIERFYFPMREIELLIKKVIYDREQILIKYGQRNYQKFMERNRIKGASKEGFWKCARYM